MVTQYQNTAQQDGASGAIASGKIGNLARTYIREDFNYLPLRSSANLGKSSKSQLRLTNPNFVINGGGGAAAVMDSDGGFVFKASSSASSASLTYLKPRTGSKLATMKYGTAEEPSFELMMKTAATITTTNFAFGFVTTRANDLTTDSYQAKFWFDTVTHATKLYAATSTNTTGTVVDELKDIGLAIAASTKYLFQVWFDTDNKPHFVVNGVEYYVGPAIDSSGTAQDLLPNIAFGPTANAAAVTCTFYHGQFSKNVA